MRSLKIIAQDMKVLGQLLIDGAAELESTASMVDLSQLTSLIGLFQGGGPIEISRPTPKQNQPSENTQSAEPQPTRKPKLQQIRPPKAILTILDRATMRQQYQHLLGQNWTKESATARITKTWPHVPIGQLKAIICNDMRKAINGQLARKAAQRNG